MEEHFHTLYNADEKRGDFSAMIRYDDFVK